MKRIPIKQRIRAALDGKTSMPYFDLMRLVFPPDQYPRATNYGCNGGPAGCCMAFGKAIREMGGMNYGMGSNRKVSVPPETDLEKAERNWIKTITTEAC